MYITRVGVTLIDDTRHLVAVNVGGISEQMRSVFVLYIAISPLCKNHNVISVKPCYYWDCKFVVLLSISSPYMDFCSITKRRISQIRMIASITKKEVRTKCYNFVQHPKRIVHHSI